MMSAIKLLVHAALAACLMATCLYSNDQDDARYAELVKQALRGDPGVDFRELRFACLKAANCDSAGDSKDVLAMRSAIRQKEFAQAAKLAERLIEQGFINIDAHITCTEAYTELGETAKADAHREIARALIRSIMKSGDGKSKETAFEVVGTHEEYIVLSMLGLRPRSQGLIAGKPHSYDRLDAVDAKSGEKVTLLFNIDAFFPPKM